MGKTKVNWTLFALGLSIMINSILSIINVSTKILPSPFKELLEITIYSIIAGLGIYVIKASIETTSNKHSVSA